MKAAQAYLRQIEHRITDYYSDQDDLGLANYLDSVLLHVELPETKRLELQLRQSIALREARDLDRAISVGHALLSGAQSGQHIKLQAAAIANLSYCYSYAGLIEKADEWRQRSFTFAREHDLTDQIIRDLSSQGYAKLGSGDFAGARAAFSEIISLCENNAFEDGLASAKGGLLNAFIYEGDLHSPVILKLLEEVKALSERPEPYSSAHERRDLLGILCNYYQEVGDPQLAVDYGRAHLAHVRKFSPDSSEIVRFALNELHPVEAVAGSYKAAYETLHYLREIERILSERSQKDQLADASAKLDVYKHETARQAAERTAQLEAAVKNDRTRLLYIISLLAAFIIAGTLYAYRRLYQDRQLIGKQKALVDQSLSEKEVLLREIHHRVKNNLQIISSLLQKQGRLAGDPDAQKLAKEGQERIQSMALIHENLYQSEQLSGVNIRSYLEDLSANISRSHNKPGKDIELDLVVADEYLDLDTAIPVGLILNELLTNAYKYAFPNGGSGRIQVVFQRVADHFELEVNDDGVGLPADHAARSSKSLGHNLVKGLVRQLDGKMNWRKPERGTGVQIEF